MLAVYCAETINAFTFICPKRGELMNINVYRVQRRLKFAFASRTSWACHLYFFHSHSSRLSKSGRVEQVPKLEKHVIKFCLERIGERTVSLPASTRPKPGPLVSLGGESISTSEREGFTVCLSSTSFLPFLILKLLEYFYR